MPLDQEIGQWGISWYAIYKALANNSNKKKLPAANHKPPPNTTNTNHQPVITVTLNKPPPMQFIQQMPNQQHAHVPTINTMLNQSSPHFNVQGITMNNTFQLNPILQPQHMQTPNPYTLSQPTYRNNHTMQALPQPNYILVQQYAQQNRPQNNIVQMDEAHFAHMI